MQRTPKHELADYLLGESVVEWIHARRPGMSWRRLSLALSEATDGKVDVTPESLRAWYVAARAEAPKTNGAVAS